MINITMKDFPNDPLDFTSDTDFFSKPDVATFQTQPEDIIITPKIDYDKSHQLVCTDIRFKERSKKNNNLYYKIEWQLIEEDSNIKIHDIYIPNYKWSLARLENIYRNWGFTSFNDNPLGKTVTAILQPNEYNGKIRVAIKHIDQWKYLTNSL